MKNSWIMALFAIFVLVFAGFLGCKDGGGGSTEKVTISFDAGLGEFEDLGLNYTEFEINKGSSVTPPTDPVREGYKLKEWNTNQGGTGIKLTASVKHNEDTDYYAIWQQDDFNVTQSWDFSNVTPDIATDDNNVNIYNLTDDILSAIKAAEHGSVICLYFDATDGRGDNRNGWSVGSIGTATSALDAIVLGLWAPNPSGFIYNVEVELEWALELINDGDKLSIFVPKNNGDKLTKIELWEPKEDREPGELPTIPELPADANVPPVPEAELVMEIPITFGYFGDPAAGKGDIMGDGITTILELWEEIKDSDVENAILRIWVRNLSNASRTSWGVGQINGMDSLSGAGPLGDRSNDIQLERIIELLHIKGESNVPIILTEPRDRLELNPYNDHIITCVQLWRGLPPSGPSISVMLGDTQVDDIVVTGRAGNVRMFPDATGYQFTATGTGHRGKYASFQIDLGDKSIADYKFIRFKLEVVSASATDRRLGLMASATAFSSSLGSTHPGGSSGAGFLCTEQITKADVTVYNPTTPTEITLEIDPARVDVLGLRNTKVLFMSIYEHTDGTADIKITDIIFDERPEGCEFCGIPCVCDAAITTAKGLIEAATYEAEEMHAGSLAAAKTATLSIINGLALNGVVPTLVDGTFTAAEDGTDGSYTFIVKLNKGDGIEQETAELTLTIIAATGPMPPVWTLASWSTARQTVTTLENSGSAHPPLRPSTGSSITTTHVPTDGTIKINMLSGAGSGHGLGILVGNATGCLNLDLKNNIYEIRISGSLDTGSTSGTIGISYPYDTSTSVFHSTVALEAGDSFEIIHQLPAPTNNPGANNSDTIRIRPSANNMLVTFTEIEIHYIGPRQ